MIYALLSSSSKRPTQIICKRKLFLLIGAITNSIKLYHQPILKRIVETIEESIRSELKRIDSLFATKKVVGQVNILGKSVRIQKISSKSGFFKALMSKQVNTFQSMKELIIKVMIILTASMI